MHRNHSNLPMWWTAIGVRVSALLLLVFLFAGLPHPVVAHDSPQPPVTPLVLEEVVTANVFPRVLTPDPIVGSWLPLIESSQLVTYVAELSGERPAVIDGATYTITTRHTDSGQPIFNAVRYDEAHLQELGTAVTRHAWHATRPPNVIGQITGTVNPGAVYMLTAHLDSTAPPGPAPGADDNASGSAAVLAAADVLSAYEWTCTLRFALWTGEEQGLLGSRAYAAAARAANEQIMGVLNIDMIGWNTIGSSPDVDFHASSTLTPTQELAQLMADVVGVYALDLNPQIVALSIGASDHASFWEQGYPAILGIEDYYPGRMDFNPYYHSANDRLSALNIPYFTEFTRAALAGFSHMSDCLATGNLRGGVTRISNGAPVGGATIVMTHTSGHIFTTTVDAVGQYSVTLPAGDYRVAAAADGFLDPTPVTVTVALSDEVVQDFALAHGASQLTKKLATPDPLRPGQELRFVVALTNTGDLPIDALHLTDSYPTAFLRFQGSQPPPDDSLDDGLLEWSQPALPLAPGASLAVTTTFRALADTSSLPGGAAQNSASAVDIVVGGGGIQSPQALPASHVSATVRILSPTGVVISGFSATTLAGRVILRWTSDNESEVAGYRLVRTNPDATPVLLTPTLIPAQHPGESTGGDYLFLDERAVFAANCVYTLQVVSLDGAPSDVAVTTAQPWTFFLPLMSRPTEP